MNAALHPDAIEEHVHRQESRSKLISLGISMFLVASLLAVLAWIVVGLPPNPSPELVVAAEAGQTNPTPSINSFATQLRARPTPPSGGTSSAITSTTASPVSFSLQSNIDVTVPGVGNHWGIGAGSFDGGGLGPGIGIPPPFRGRCDSADRAQRLARAGGKASLDRSVLDALRWLKDKQQDDGHWGQKFPVSMTAFALLAFSGHCETVDSPEFGETVKKAIEYLIGVAEKNKGMMASTMDRNTSYEHGIAVYALAEAYSLNKNARKPFKRISPTLKKAVPIVIEGQTNGGGWLYSYGSNGTGDLSVSGWNVQALKAAEYTGLKFSGLTAAKKKAAKYIEAAEDPNGTDGYFRYRVQDSQKGKLSLTGVGLLCARMLGSPSKLEDKGLDKILAAAPKAWSKPNLYAWYYHSQAAFQKQGKAWRKYNDTYQKVVAEAQQKDGSWTDIGGHAASVGPDANIYATCLCTLMLEVYYRYLPTGR